MAATDCGCDCDRDRGGQVVRSLARGLEGWRASRKGVRGGGSGMSSARLESKKTSNSDGGGLLKAKAWLEIKMQKPLGRSVDVRGWLGILILGGGSGQPPGRIERDLL